MIDPQQIAGLGLLGAALYFIVSLFGGRGVSASISSGDAEDGNIPVPQQKPAILTYPKNRTLTTEEVFQLAQYMADLGLRVDPLNLVAVAAIESSFRPWVTRSEPKINDASSGLMQTLVGTARDLYNKGYKTFGVPDKETLKNPAVSMYFGAAYLDWLHKSYPNHDLEWYVRAYNGGYGGATKSYTVAYWNKFLTARKKYSGGPYLRFG